MKHLLIVLLPILLMGFAMGSEPERKKRVQALIKQLGDRSLESRQAAYSELRDTFVRKRDIPELTKEIAQNANPQVKKSLGELIPFMKGKWRLPDKGWTNDWRECRKTYGKEFTELGCAAWVLHCDYAPKTFLELEVLEFPAEAEIRSDAVNLIITLEPQSLRLFDDSWGNISYVGLLSNLEELNLTLTSVTDLTPLKGLTGLRKLTLLKTPVTDLTPLGGLSSLRELVIDDAVTDLTPLKGLTELRQLTLLNAPVTDLTPLEGLPNLEMIHTNTKTTEE